MDAYFNHPGSSKKQNDGLVVLHPFQYLPPKHPGWSSSDAFTCATKTTFTAFCKRMGAMWNSSAQALRMGQRRWLGSLGRLVGGLEAWNFMIFHILWLMDYRFYISDLWNGWFCWFLGRDQDMSCAETRRTKENSDSSVVPIRNDMMVFWIWTSAFSPRTWQFQVDNGVVENPL